MMKKTTAAGETMRETSLTERMKATGTGEKEERKEKGVKAKKIRARVEATL